jgi:hypothetical protein
MVGPVSITPPHASARLRYLYPALPPDQLYSIYSSFSIHSTKPSNTSTFAMNNLDQKIAQIEQISGYTFQNRIHAAESVQHANEVAFVPVEGSFHDIVKSTRLAIVGNDLLNSILSTMWYEFRTNQGTKHIVIQRPKLTTG